MSPEKLMANIETIVEAYVSDASNKGKATKELCDAVTKHTYTTQLRRRRTRKTPSSCSN